MPDPNKFYNPPEKSDLIQLLDNPGFEKLAPQEQLDGIKKYDPRFADAQLWQLPELKHKLKREEMSPLEKAVDWMDNPQDNPVPGMQPRTTSETLHNFLSTAGGLQDPARISNRVGSAVSTGVPAALTGGPIAGATGAAMGFMHPMRDASDLAINIASAGVPAGQMLAKPGLKEVLKAGLKGGALTQALHIIGQGANEGVEAIGIQQPREKPRTFQDYIASPLATALGSAPPALSQWQVANKVANSPIAVSRRFQDVANDAKGAPTPSTIAQIPEAGGVDAALQAEGPWQVARQRFIDEENDKRGIEDRIRQTNNLIDQSKSDAKRLIAEDVESGTKAAVARQQALAALNDQRSKWMAEKDRLVLQKAGIKTQNAGTDFDRAVNEEQGLYTQSPDHPAGAMQPEQGLPFKGSIRNAVTGKYQSSGGPKTLDELQIDAIKEGENNIAVLQNRLREANRQGDKASAQSVDNAILVQQQQNLARKGAMTQLKQQRQAFQTEQKRTQAAQDVETADRAFSSRVLYQKQSETQGEINLLDAQGRKIRASTPVSEAQAVRTGAASEQQDMANTRQRFQNDYEDIKTKADQWDAQNVGVRNLAWDTRSPDEMLTKLFQANTGADQIRGMREHLESLGPEHVKAFQSSVIDQFMKLAYDPTTKTFSNAQNLFDSQKGGFNYDKIRELFGPTAGKATAERFRTAITDVTRATDMGKEGFAARIERGAIFAAPTWFLWSPGAGTMTKVGVGAAVGMMGVEWPKLINKIMRDSTFADQFHQWLAGPEHAQRSLQNWPRMAAWLKENSNQKQPLSQKEIQDARDEMQQEQAVRSQQQQRMITDQQIRQSTVGQNPQPQQAQQAPTPNQP